MIPPLVPDAFDPASPAFVSDPYPVYGELRKLGPVSWSPRTGQYVVARAADVDAVLRDRRFGRSYLQVATHAEMGRPEDPLHLAPFWDVVRNGMLDTEPPDHTRLRRLVAKAFTPRRVEGMRASIDRIATGLVDDLLAAGADGSPVDLKPLVAEPLPVDVIADLLGVPQADRHLLRPWSQDMCRMYELRPTADDEARAVSAAEEFAAYLRALAAERRARPQDDLVTALTEVVDEGERLTEDELVGTCVLLLNAGHEATVGVTVNGVATLLRHPDQLERLRADLSLVPTAVEEVMRYDTPLQLFSRWALEDADVGGVPVARGSQVALLFGSANRDPERFEDPDRLDVGRSSNPHISFGAGIHFCLGAPLARLELQTVFAELVRRVPRLALAAEPELGRGYIIRILETLPVTVG
ncbi:cytochrome P450 [Motilibacter aurantiacus]|uniref:cytochrome P450 n=1 Tax=Motilibacter aurantiacus TaxID=2714955 RepID=UPI00140ADE1F|nr:cytochrome P450 [Motilibacter aurantiacus]NHC44230.1 cytochrome P450 [Motilibacter aurantiacus]